MKIWKSKLLVGALALATSPLLAAPQGAPAEQNSAGNPLDSSRTQVQPNQDQQRRRHHRRRHHRRQHRRHHRRHAAMLLRNPAFRERLGITSEQAARVEVQQSAFQKAMIRSRAEAQVKRLELRELLMAEKPDRTLIDQKFRQLNEAQFAVQKLMLENRLAMREMFTPEQREKLRQLFWEMRRGDEPFGPGA